MVSMGMHAVQQPSNHLFDVAGVSCKGSDDRGHPHATSQSPQLVRCSIKFALCTCNERYMCSTPDQFCRGSQSDAS